MKKKPIHLGLYSSLFLLLCGCSNGVIDVNDYKVKEVLEATSNNDIWGTFASEKIVQNRERSYYQEKEKEASISILSCKGESEMGQVIVSPKNDVNYFDARISDLISEKGDILSKKDIDVFAAKYLKIDFIYDLATNETKGYFPDALIPVSAIVKDGSNKIDANTNQSFYIKVNTRVTQRAGIYSGTLYIQLNNAEYKVAVTVDVKDYVVNQVTHSKSLFLNDWSYDSGENESSQEKLDAYNNALLKYRLSPDKLISSDEQDNKFDDKFIYRYTEKAYQFMQNPSCTNVSIPYAPTVESSGGIVYYQNINKSIFKKFLTSYYVKSISENYNMFDKSAFYCGIIDEPDDRSILDQTRVVVESFRTVVSETADELERTGYTNHPLHNDLIKGIRELKNIVTCAYSDDYSPYIDTWCPKANFYHTPEQRANYASQKEKWWYTCVYPRAPYPTYHIEDGLTSARALSWMQAEYDVVGNLFWATNVYARYNGQQYVPIEDYYTEGYRFTGVNGDGFLFYPGEPLGSESPFGSTRLESIRDGLEEYELFYNLKEEMNNLEIDKQGMFNFLTRYLYNGTKVSGGTKEMEEARKDLVDLCLANSNGSNFLISGCNYNEAEGQVELEFYAKDGATIEFNGDVISGTSYKDGKKYNVIQKLDKVENIANIKVSYNGKVNTIAHSLGGQIKSYSASDLVEGFSNYNAKVTASLVNEGEESLVKVDVSSVNNKRQTIKYAPKFIKDINNDTQSVRVTFKNTTDQDIKIGIGAKFANVSVNTYLAQEEILKKNDYTTIVLDLSTTPLATYGDLENFTFVLGEDDSEGLKEAVTFYLKDVVITY